MWIDWVMKIIDMKAHYLSAAALFLLWLFSLSQCSSWILFSSSILGRSALNLRLDFVWQGSEGLFDVNCVLSRGFEELDAQRLGKGFSFFGFDLSVGLKIGFVSDEEFDNILIAIFINFGKPVFDVLERLSVGDVIDEDDSVGSFVVWGGDGFESLLSGGVPDL